MTKKTKSTQRDSDDRYDCYFCAGRDVSKRGEDGKFVYPCDTCALGTIARHLEES